MEMILGLWRVALRPIWKYLVLMLLLGGVATPARSRDLWCVRVARASLRIAKDSFRNAVVRTPPDQALVDVIGKVGNAELKFRNARTEVLKMPAGSPEAAKQRAQRLEPLLEAVSYFHPSWGMTVHKVADKSTCFLGVASPIALVVRYEDGEIFQGLPDYPIKDWKPKYSEMKHYESIPPAKPGGS